MVRHEGISRTITPLGYGQADGEIIVEMTNHLNDVDLPVLYVEVLPWYIRPYLHTMKTEVFPKELAMKYEPGTVSVSRPPL